MICRGKKVERRQAKQILIDQNNKEFFQRREHKGQYKTWFHLLDLEGGRVLLDALSEKDLTKLVKNLAERAAMGWGYNNWLFESNNAQRNL